jgi:hypothetical protein
MAEQTASIERWGWVTALATFVIPPLVLVAFTLGAIAAGKGRAGQGAGIMSLALLVLLFGLSWRGVV